MAAGGRELASVGEGISDIWYPYPKKMQQKVLLLI